MIIVNIKNGLGNQMFQYAFGKVLETKYGEKVWFDLMRDGEDKTPLVSDLDVFQIEPILEVSQKLVEPFKPFSVAYYRIHKKYLAYIYFKIRRMVQPNRLITERFPAEYTRFFENLNSRKKYYFLGFWQNASYYTGFEDKIRKLFLPKDNSVYQSALAREISQSRFETVSLHIRRGDYLTAGFIEPVNEKYIYDALNLIRARLKNPFFYIFTDDPHWVKENLVIAKSFKVVEGNEGKNSYKDIILMSLCQHNIIANSSFSWWGAWLNAYAGKIVIAPKKWYSTPERDQGSAFITPKEWIRL